MIATGSLTGALAREMAETPADAVPAEAMDAARRLIVDHVGITYMGAALTGPALFDYARDLGGRADAVLIGAGIRVPAELAAGVNGQHCRATNFEESGPGRHIGPLCVHTALAAGQRAHRSGRDVVAAAALGYVLCARFHFAQRVDSGLPHHRVVAAGIAARLFGYDSEKTARAISLAWELPHRARPVRTGEQPASFFRRKRISPLGTPGALASPLFHARAGIQAAVMVQHGFASVADEIDEYAWDYDTAALTRQPVPFDLVRHMELKPWPCVRPGQCAIQALDSLVRDHGLAPDTVTAVTLRVPGVATVPHQCEPEPETYWEAVYSLQWAAAMVLQSVPPGPQWFTPERRADPLSRRLAAGVALVEDPESTAAYAAFRRQAVMGTAEVHAAGRIFAARRSLGDTFGGAASPMTDTMVEDKFMAATSLSLPAARGRDLLARLRGIDDVRDICDLAAHF